jgi:hypothetical protein
MPDPKIIRSPLCQKFTGDGITVDVEIYRIDTADGWSLELVDGDGTSTVWDEQFATDQGAYDEFLESVEQIGLANTLLADDDEFTTLH